MMKTFRLFSMAALALMMAACSSEDNTLETASPAMPGKLQFTATVEAPGTGATTRTEYTKDTDAESKSIIKVAWKENDEIAAVVTNSEGKYVKDVLTVSKVNTDGSATITGDITKPKDDALTVDLIYPADIVTVAADGSAYSIDFAKMRDGSTLDGTPEKIAANIDYRRADACPLTVSGDKAELTSAAKLESKLSIWKLTLQDVANGNNLYASQVTIKDGDGVTMVSSAASGSEVYLPVPDASGIDIAISATVGDDTYYYMKGGVTLAAGKYYESTVKMAKPTNLSTISSNYEVQNGEVLTGTLANNVKITIADGATVLLKDVTITNLGNGCNWAGINCPGNATLVLEGTNEVCAGRDGHGDNNYPGIYIAPDKTLTIQGDGTLTAYSNGTNPWGAGIGGGFTISLSCGNIVINGGTVIATGGAEAAGIGGGRNSSCGTITITSGVTSVTATKGSSAPNSIGAGKGGTCGTVTIEDASKVTQN